MKSKMVSVSLIFLLAVLINPVVGICEGNPQKETDIRGIYGHPQPLWDKGYDLADLGVNAIFVHSGSIDEKLIEKAREQGIRVYAEFPTLNGKGYVEEHTEAWAINEKGKRVEAASRFMGVCPTEPGFRNYRYQQLRKLLADFQLDGIWMDYVHWHAQFEEPDPILPETCFCESCLSAFTSDTGIEMPEGTTSLKADWILNNHEQKWRDWRCEVIAALAADIRKIVDEVRPGILLGIYHCPWDDDEFNGARRRILGLDYDLLAKQVDVFSPMVYHARMGRSPEWVAENISWFSNRIEQFNADSLKIWPIVQAYDNPYEISATEFETVLKGGLTGNATGIMMFTTRAIADSKEKIAVMKSFYSNLSKR